MSRVLKLTGVVEETRQPMGGYYEITMKEVCEDWFLEKWTLSRSSYIYVLYHKHASSFWMVNGYCTVRGGPCNHTPPKIAVDIHRLMNFKLKLGDYNG